MQANQSSKRQKRQERHERLQKSSNSSWRASRKLKISSEEQKRIKLFEDAKHGDQQAIQEVRQMDALVWQEKEIEAVNIVRNLSHHDWHTDRTPVDTTLFVRRHYLDPPEEVKSIWVKYLEGPWYVGKFVTHDNCVVYVAFTANKQWKVNVTHWVSERE